MTKGNLLTELWEDQSEWSQRTFGSDKERGPSGPLKHLAKEAFEALNASPLTLRQLSDLLAGITKSEEPVDIVELADCGLLILDAVRRAGYTLDDWMNAMYSKQAINIHERKWGPAGNDDLVEHEKERGEK